MIHNPFKSEYFDTSSYISSDKTLHYYTNSSVNHIPIKYHIKSSLESEEDFNDFYLSKTFLLKTHENIDYDLDFLEFSKPSTRDSLLQVPIEHLLAEINEQYAEKLKNQPDIEILKTEPLGQKDLWTTKYMPKRFDELLSDEKINREVLCWLKSWDPIVFPDRKRPIKQMPIFMSPKKPMSPMLDKFDKVHLSFSFNKKPNNFINFDLDDSHSLYQLQNNVLLLAGPPGTGKTTLARIVAMHCGYKPIEINASDDRTAEKLIQKIESACQSRSLNVSEKENKPSLIILDEVDGTSDYEGKGTMKLILDYIFKGERKANETTKKPKGFAKDIKEKDKDKENNKENTEEIAETDDFGENIHQTNQQKEKIQIKRPIIFICNDIYAKGLRELRKKAIVFHFRKTQTEKLINRLREICNKERILIDHETLLRLCDSNDNDIRSCLNTLELISRGKKEANKGARFMNNIVLKENSFLNNKKENTKGCLDIMEDLIYKNQRNERNLNIMGYCMGQISRSVEYQILYETIFYNYTKIKQCERDFERLVRFLNLLSDSEVVENNIKKNQLFELTRFTMLPCVFLNLCFVSNEKIKLEFPYKMAEFKKESKISMEKIHNIKENYPLKSAVYINPHKIVIDLFSHIFQIIQPNLTSSILNENEKQDVQSAIFIMLDFSLSLLSNSYKYLLKNPQNPNVKEFYEMEYAPSNIEKLLIFTKIVPQKKLTQRTKIIIQNNFEYLKNLRQTYYFDENKSKNGNLDLDAQKNKIMETDYYSNQNFKKRKLRINNDHIFTYKYLEGVNNSIKYDVQIEMFFPKKASNS